MSTLLKERATAARDARVRGDRAGFAHALEAVRAALAEADAAWRTWHETGFILDARPDLVFVKPEHGKAN